ncbi:MAG: hypothetical protein ACTSYI_07310 [Promethearchaeota archaeon]
MTLFWSFLFHGLFLIYIFFSDLTPFFQSFVLFTITLWGIVVVCFGCVIIILLEFIRPHLYFRPIYSTCGWIYSILSVILVVIVAIFQREWISTAGISMLFFGVILLEIWGFKTFLGMVEKWTAYMDEKRSPKNGATPARLHRNGYGQIYNLQYFNFLAIVAVILAALYGLDLFFKYDNFNILQIIYGVILLVALTLILIEALFQLFVHNRSLTITSYTAFRVLFFALIFILSLLWTAQMEMVYKLPFFFFVFTSALAMKYKSFMPVFGGAYMSYSI